MRYDPHHQQRSAETEFNGYLEELSGGIYKLKSKSVFKPQTLIACPHCGNALSVYTKVYGGNFTEALCRCEKCKQDNK